MSSDAEADGARVANASHQAGGGHTTWQSARQTYDHWADSYDKDHVNFNYNGPKLAASTLRTYVADQQAHILDVGCGTGFVGEQLKSFGYSNVDGLDGSEAMLKQANSKEVYKRLIAECLTPNPSENISDNSYDAVVMSGAFGGGHLAVDIWKELIRITKPGGYIVNVMREKWLLLEQYKDKLEPGMDELAAEGKWSQISREILKNYVHSDSGVIHVYKVT